MYKYVDPHRNLNQILIYILFNCVAPIRCCVHKGALTHAHTQKLLKIETRTQVDMSKIETRTQVDMSAHKLICLPNEILANSSVARSKSERMQSTLTVSALVVSLTALSVLLTCKHTQKAKHSHSHLSSITRPIYPYIYLHELTNAPASLYTYAYNVIQTNTYIIVCTPFYMYTHAYACTYTYKHICTYMYFRVRSVK